MFQFCLQRHTLPNCCKSQIAGRWNKVACLDGLSFLIFVEKTFNIVFHLPSFQTASFVFLIRIISLKFVFQRDGSWFLTEDQEEHFYLKGSEKRYKFSPRRNLVFNVLIIHNICKHFKMNKKRFGIDEKHQWVLNCFQSLISFLVKTLIYKAKAVSCF